MSAWPDIEDAIRAASGSAFAIASRARVGGGCINESYLVRGGGQACFVKVNAAEKASMFAAEALGLEELGRAGAVRVPRPLCHGSSDRGSWLVLEYLDIKAPHDSAMAVLGRNLARLHGVTADRYGWGRDNAIGATPQPNAPSDNWIRFWRERRLCHQLELAAARGCGGRLIAGGLELADKLPRFFAGYRPRPALLHGDLWSGNAAMTAGGEPVIYDPAVYYGDRETDLAMTELFGGFPRAFYDVYRDEFPLDPGYEVRKHLYNLYHVLNHLNLFGGGYAAQAENMIERLLAEA